MKKTKQILTLVLFSTLLILGCSKDSSIIPPEEMIGEAFEMVDIQVVLPTDSTADLSGAFVVSLGNSEMLNDDRASEIPFNPGTSEIAYLIDEEDNLLLAGFITDERKEISVATTVEVMLYYAFDYYLLPDNAKKAFLDNVQKSPDFNGLLSSITELFTQDPKMYTNGSYIPALQASINQITSKKTSSRISNRIFFNDEETKSGVTLSSIDSTNIKLQNSLPRRAHVIIYKKSVLDRNGVALEIPNYTNTPFLNFEMEAGKTSQITELEVGSALSQISIQQASVENSSDTGPILLPVDSSAEFEAEYEVNIIGSGLPNANGRDMNANEREIYEELATKTYILDYFLPTLLEIGGNKSLLPSFGSDKEEALFNAVLPVLEQYSDIMQQVTNNEFKNATNQFLPALYDDIRISNDLRTILGDVYNIISENGTLQNTFIQSQELIETGEPRTKVILRAIDRNIKANNTNANIGGLRTAALNFENWLVKSIDAVVELQQSRIELCLGEATEIRLSLITSFEPEVEEVEFHWSTSNKFAGRVQDIGGDANNFGVSIISKNNFVSYISGALASDLGDGENLETVSVIAYFKNKNTGVLTEAGRDSMTVNNIKSCDFFTVGIARQPNFRESSIISCTDEIGYQAFSPVPYKAVFEAVEGAVGYNGFVTRSDGSVGGEFRLPNLGEPGDAVLTYNFGVGSIIIQNGCDSATVEQQAADLIPSIEPVSITITPIF